MIAELFRTKRIIDSLPIVPIKDFPQLIFQTRKTSVYTQNIDNPQLVLKRPTYFIEENPRKFLETNQHYRKRRYQNSVAYNIKEFKKQEISLQYVQDIKNLTVPEEQFRIAIGRDEYPEPYRTQPYQKGEMFESVNDFWGKVTKKQLKVLRDLLRSDLRFYEDFGYHLDLIGFRSDREPTLEEIAEIYKDPFPKATNLLLMPDGRISWTDPKTSNLTHEKNQIRAQLLAEMFSRLEGHVR